ncbi:MAG: M48 family metallopeptidase [Verrucomicrobia bacterium]|nr:M48 family metallopeptidase [Verrucomicrobiota bacterium]
MKISRCWWTWAGLAVVGIALVACMTVEETGRKQLILLSADQEMKMGLTAFEETKKQIPQSKDAAATALVQKVGKRIAAVANMPNAQWEFVLFENKEPNAFCLPGGKVGINTGILPITRDEAGLATVMSHEVAHATKRHGAERVSRAMVRQSGGEVATALLGGEGGKNAALVAGVYGMGTQLLEALPHSRTQETEADQVGLLYMARAGYDPEAAIGFWQRFAEYNRRAGNTSSGFSRYFRTHPTDEQRIKDLQLWLPRAKAEYRPAAGSP